MKKFKVLQNFRGGRISAGRSVITRHDVTKYEIDDVVQLWTDETGLPKDRFWRFRLKDNDIEILVEKPVTKKKKEDS